MLEPGEIDVAVESQTMSCDVTRSVNSNCADLPVANPHSSVCGCLGSDSVFLAQVDDGFFDVTNVPANARLEVLEINDWISDELTWAMKSYQAAAIRSMEVRSKLSQLFLFVDCVILRTDPNCVHWVMLGEDDNVFELDITLNQSARDFLLQLLRFAIVKSSSFQDVNET